MSDDGVSSGREYGRALFVCGCALALILSAALLPSITASFGQTPVETLLSDQSGQNIDGQLGALNPGRETTVGGLDAGDTQSFRSQSAEVHFVVESTDASYWRTGAYDTYTGSGWRQTEAANHDGDPFAVDGLVNRTVSYQVQLNRTASALPTVWRPQSVQTDSGFAVTAQRAIRTDAPLSPGDTYSARSAVPPRDPSILATAGRDYPPAIREQYTQLPGPSSVRLGSFTERLTADAETPYETAVQVEQWLEANKSYSLNVSRPEGDSVASDFVFEMDAGYCEYYATAMVAMLRSQDIPARYVVGYSTGQRTGESTYTVRGMNAHAWVEVYFPDVGWVTFDPTPGRERLEAEREALRQQRPDAGSYDHTERGSPGETFSSNDTGPDLSAEIPAGILEEPNPDNSTTDAGDERDATYDITLSQRPVPGRSVTVSVERDGEPVPDAIVSFNGEPIGETDWTGHVSGMVPYAERLSVTVDANATADATTEDEDPDIVWEPTPGTGAPTESVATATRSNVPVESSGAIGDADALFAIDSRPLSRLSYRPAATNNTTERRTYDLPTDAKLSISGTMATGEDVSLTVTVDGQPVPAATVERDGTVVGTTDDDGRLDVTLPSTPGETVLTVRRGSVTGNRTLELAALDIDVETDAPLALPGTGVTVTARRGNETVAGAPIRMNGERLGTTGVDGTAKMSLPLSRTATITVDVYGQRETVTVGGLWRNLGLVAGVAATLVVGAVVVFRRREALSGALLSRLVAGVAALPQSLVAVLAGAADAIVGGWSRAVDRVAESLAQVRAVIRGEESPRKALSAVEFWVRSIPSRLRGALPLGTTATERESETATRSESYVTIREAWAEFLDVVSVRDPEVMTPGELATHAVERDDLPPDAVRRLRDAFRDVEYGDRSPAERCRDVEAAIEQLEAERTEANG